MGRPTTPYSQRNVQSYQRDREYLIRLRAAIFLDEELDSNKIKDAVEKIDALLLTLRDLTKKPAEPAATA